MKERTALLLDRPGQYELTCRSLVLRHIGAGASGTESRHGYEFGARGGVVVVTGSRIATVSGHS
jgi:hypothetical protein